MKIVAAPAAFKGSLSAAAAAQAIIAGVRRAVPPADILALPVADGGEGTVEALVTATGGWVVGRRVTGPLGDPVDAGFGVIGRPVIPGAGDNDEGTTAIIEMAAAAGLTLVPPDRRDPRITTTRGVGELIGAALDVGSRRLVIGIGGSATNDGGAGMAQALGARLLDAGGSDLRPGGAALARLAAIDISGLDRRLARCQSIIACDVDNPLAGPEGASATYGPQKGATAEMVAELDAALTHYGEIIARDLGKQVADRPGAGAAGGLGAGLMAFLDAELRPGVEVVMEVMRFREHVAGAYLVITGEGRLDAQTLRGKAIAGVARVARREGVPVIALAGRVQLSDGDLGSLGLVGAHSIAPPGMAESEAVSRGAELLAAAAERVVSSCNGWRRG